MVQCDHRIVRLQVHRSFDLSATTMPSVATIATVKGDCNYRISRAVSSSCCLAEDEEGKGNKQYQKTRPDEAQSAYSNKWQEQRNNLLLVYWYIVASQRRRRCNSASVLWMSPWRLPTDRYGRRIRSNNFSFSTRLLLHLLLLELLVSGALDAF